MEPVLPDLEARELPVLPEHPLEEILVRVDTPADLVRASAACKAFRRLINGSSFLRRYRSIHPPLLLGFIHYNPPFDSRFVPADAPHPNALAARALAGASDFSFRHIPTSHWWSPCDARDGLVLLLYYPSSHKLESPELAVCDPLTRGYTRLPPVSDDLLDSVRDQVQVQGKSSSIYAFFDPSGANDETQFRVIFLIHCSSIAVKFVYSSVSGSWTHGISTLQVGNDPIMGLQQSSVYGCLYWTVGTGNKMIKLDNESMESITVSLPADYEKRKTVAVEDGEGKIGMFNFIPGFGNRPLLRYSIRQNESGNANELLVDSTVSLPSEYDFYDLDGAGKGYIFLVGEQGDRYAFFSLEVKTLTIERMCFFDYSPYRIPYFGYPPFMSPRRM